MASIALLAAQSVQHYGKLVVAGTLHLSRRRLGRRYRVEFGGTYRIFRETIGGDVARGKGAVLIVGFRLKLIRSSPLLHWLFQRVCILTTPFWSGFKGFRIKLWMVNQETKDYLGIYEWMGEANARRYVDALLRVLRPLSVPGSVWYELLPGTDFEHYLTTREV